MTSFQRTALTLTSCFVLTTLLAGCGGRFAPFGDSNISQDTLSLPPQTTITESELPPLAPAQAISQAALEPAATESLVATVARPWTLADREGKLSCALVLTNADVSGTDWKRANAGGSCFNQLNFVVGWQIQDNRLSLYNAKNEIMAQLVYINEKEFQGETTRGLPIRLYY